MFSNLLAKKKPNSGAVLNFCPSSLQAPGAQTSSTVISFAQKTFANGVLTSKLHVIELGAAPGESTLSYSAQCPWHALEMAQGASLLCTACKT